MSEETSASSEGGAAATTTESFLDRAIGATKQTEADRVGELMTAFVDGAMAGQVKFSKNLTVTFREAIKEIDRKLSEQLAEVMHHEKFKSLEGSWRGLKYLVDNSLIGSDLKVKVLNCSKRQLQKDFDDAVEFDQSQMFKKVYEEAIGTAGGVPFGALIGDYQFSAHPEDVDILRNVSSVAAGAFAPFIAGAGHEMFGFDDYRDLPKRVDLARNFESSEYTAWRGFRDTEDSRFVALAMPRVLSRLPYGKATKTIDEFDYEEAPYDNAGNPQQMEHDDYCWMNASYAAAVTMTRAYSESGLCVAIRGENGGGKLDNLPTHTFVSDDGDMDAQCPAEVGITDRREKELSDLGFLPLVHYKNTDFAVFLGGQTTQKPKKYTNTAATENAAISARLPYMMATSRFAHCLKIMGRSMIGSFADKSSVSKELNDWIYQYVNETEGASQAMRAEKPLRKAQVVVEEVPGRPGSYHAVAHLQPWLQFEELTTSMRMVARIPSAG